MRSPMLFLSASLGLGAAVQAQQDDTATRAFSNVAIMTSEGRYLATNGDNPNGPLLDVWTAPWVQDFVKRWDVITAGKHNDRPGYVLIFDTETQRCLTFGGGETPGWNPVYLEHCGGKEDGSGGVLTSQLFAYDGHSVITMLRPLDGEKFNKCLTANEDTLGYLVTTKCEPSVLNTFVYLRHGTSSDVERS